MADKRRGLPAVPLGVDPGVRTLLDRVKALLEEGIGSRGAAGDRWVRASEIDGLSSGGGDGGVIVSPGGSITLDTTPPPAPSGLAASAGLGVIHLTWDAPAYGSDWSAHSHAVIRRGTTTVFADATIVGQAPLGYFPDPVGDDRSDFYYWVSFVSRAAVAGPPSAMAGPVQTSIDPSYITEALSSTDPDAVLFEVPAGGTTINGVAVPAGVYMKAAYMPYGVINQLHFDRATGNRVIAQDGTFGMVLADTLKVLNANIAGEIKSDDYAAGSAGWRISKDGFAELSNAVVRGAVYADTGWFKGRLQLGEAASMTNGNGLFAGDDAGTWKWRLGQPGSARAEWNGTNFAIYDQAGNLTLSTGSPIPLTAIEQITAANVASHISTGAIFTEQLHSINASTGFLTINTAQMQLDVDGNAFFSGNLSGATGTFAGSLAAGVIDFSAFLGTSDTYGPGEHTIVVPNDPNWTAVSMRVSLQAGGGGGGGANTWSGGSLHLAGGGGEAGQFVTSIFDEFSILPGDTLTLTVGAGGAVSASSSGQKGFDTFIKKGATTLDSATGGAGGGPGTASAGGVGGSSHADTNNGANGQWGGSATTVYGGTGGSSGFGGGGTSGVGVSGAGVAAGAGAGGGGKAMNQYSSRFGGTSGGNGFAIIEFYDPNVVVLRKSYNKLIEWLDTIGHGAVPLDAR